MIKSIVTLMLFASFSSFGQNEYTVPPIDLDRGVTVRGCSRPIIQLSPASCCAVVVRKEEKSEEVLDITDPEISGLVASPNPTKGHLSVSIPASLIGFELTVLDMTGRVVGNPREITGTTENLNIEGESGVYLIVIRTEKETITERILLDTQ